MWFPTVGLPSGDGSAPLGLIAALASRTGTAFGLFESETNRSNMLKQGAGPSLVAKTIFEGVSGNKFLAEVNGSRASSTG